MEINDQDVTLRKIEISDLTNLWQIAYQEAEPEWMKWNGPYFNDPKYTYEVFMADVGPSWVNSAKMHLVLLKGQPIGIATWHWEDGSLQQWLEYGLVLFVESSWGSGLGTKVSRLWIDHLFATLPHIQRVGFTTWSGNRGMMKIGDKLGMTQEACLRKVRYYQGTYYDSIKFGILREEWLS